MYTSINREKKKVLRRAVRRHVTNRVMLWTSVWLALGLAVIVCPPAPCYGGEFVRQSPIADYLGSVRYGYATDMLASQRAPSVSFGYGSDTGSEGDEFGNHMKKQKSPLKAFLLSAAVPGLGQWYYGSRIKPFLFLGAEVAAWTLHATWHKDGRDAEDAYEDFHNVHWSETRYEDYLEMAYQGVGGEFRDDDSLSFREISHHLPDQWTQQYFEMTGKYDQFAWGWDDAVYNDGGEEMRLPDYWDNYQNGYTGTGRDTLEIKRITGEETLPRSERRDRYETMRNDANNKFDKARRMLTVAIVNRLVSALEAYFVTKSQQNKSDDDEEFFSKLKPSILERVHVSAKLKSYHSKRDTPYVKFTYKF
ncbi:hypothetical protein GF377_00720 [candidate division GN15 bacterium]|nr:hypothetical protein [candidate division GN15 bacterium]